ncbi:hypothetical protein CF326_g7161 [Tilletia indica]|nr:hypothetical protein CF326_g7161 [Tilletia indica]
MPRPRQRPANTQNQNPHGLTGEGVMSVSQMAKELAAMRVEQQQLMESMRAIVSHQQDSSSGSNPSSSSNIPADVAFSASSGPIAAPGGRKHYLARIRRSWRRLLEQKMGDGRKRPYEYNWPTSMSAWPVRLVRGRDGEPDREVRYLRLNYSKPYKHEDNQGQLRPLFSYLLTHRQQNGVPANMTREELVSMMAVSFNYLRRQNRLRASRSGRAQAAKEKTRSQLHARKRTKRKGRMDALNVRNEVKFADGSVVGRTDGAKAELYRRRYDMRADIEFAVQTLVHSPETTETERTRGGERVVARPLHMEWRSRNLNRVLHTLDDEAIRVRPYLVRECQAVFQLPSTFRLPSTVRRWMVSSEWQERHPNACLDVSDNAGPFDLDNEEGFAVIGSQLAWGSPVPANERPAVSTGLEDGEEEPDYFTHRGRAASEDEDLEDMPDLPEGDDDDDDEDDDEDDEDDEDDGEDGEDGDDGGD